MATSKNPSCRIFIPWVLSCWKVLCVQVVKCQTEAQTWNQSTGVCSPPALRVSPGTGERELRPSAPERSGSALVRRPTESPNTVDNRASGDNVEPAAVSRKPQPRRGGERAGGCQRPEPLRRPYDILCASSPAPPPPPTNTERCL